MNYYQVYDKNLNDVLHNFDVIAVGDSSWNGKCYIFTAEYDGELFIVTDCFNDEDLYVSTSVYKFETEKERSDFIKKYRKKYFKIDREPINIKFGENSKKHFSGI